MSDDLITNERTRLLASALNTACTSCFTVGVATPIAGYVYNVSGFRSGIEIGAIVISLVIWLAAAASLHMIARTVIGGLR